MVFLATLEPWLQALIGMVALLVAAIALRLLALWVLKPVLRRVRRRANAWPTDILLDDAVLVLFARMLPWAVVQRGVELVPHLNTTVATVVSNVAMALIALLAVRMLMAMLDALLALQQKGSAEDADQASAHRVRSIKSYVQLGKLMLMLAGAIIAVAVLMDRSPLIVLSGLGAMSAVLMLVFKDTILSFTAGVQLSSNDMLRIGDWIEMPQVGADGDVIDIALHTVKVQNWDKTITTIPTWRLMTESYRNWRGMSESGGRRIKRTLLLDASTIRFLDEVQTERFSAFALLHEYIENKRAEVEHSNDEARSVLGERVELIANQRRLTNIGTFRAYVLAYLRAHPGIHQRMTLMVRTLQPTAEGVPLELYCFTSSTAWLVYEATQGDIFDHLLAILPEFGLRLYQHPSGADVHAGVAALVRGE
ncbi:MAG: mechanosensitive ion channel family protein [Simplicispira suum]|uniref:mechanosensitive ion channel family protein n=1 Tax=Simplicispira suum TaxID=2109915 RepID=UPI001C6B0D39|nr:mechanosensitive ion channel family protein [Simplicispira suum]MBW7833148.1 mechanosensitive ion channel family protein [Simplicispira suum]